MSAGRLTLLFVILSQVNVWGETRFVYRENATPIPPYTNWASAATCIQDAIDSAGIHDLILVTNGVYDNGGRVVLGANTNRIAIDKSVTVASLGGPLVTRIVGEGPGGSSAVRCAYVGTNASLSGFTLENGHTMTDGVYEVDMGGGGAWCESSGFLSNCVIRGNRAEGYGGGVYGGSLFDCVATGNTAWSFGGGVYRSSAVRSDISQNTGYFGGGAYESLLLGCVLSGNVSQAAGGGACLGGLTNCALLHNQAMDGGGAGYARLLNCVLIGNVASSFGGGARDSSLVHCTIVGNVSGFLGGGVYQCGLLNSIVYFNTNTSPHAGDFNHAFSALDSCCTTPVPSGDARIPLPPTTNISSVPSFLDAGSGFGTNHVLGNYRLQPDSPCVDSATNAPSAAYATDLDGHPRLVNWIPDMGAYEYQGIVNPDTDRDGIPNDWEGPRGLNPAVSNAPTANADGDPSTDWQEFVADTAPTNALDYLRLLDVSDKPPPDMTVSFSSSTNRFYMLQHSTPLASGVWTNVLGAGPRRGIGGLDHMQDTNAPPEAPARFYRIEATLP